MSYKDPRFVEIYEEIKELRKKFYRVQKELRHEKKRESNRKLEQSIGDLKWLIAWSLLDCGEIKKGFAICRTLSWRTHGEEKYIGIGRALVDMKHYAEARRVLEKGFVRFPGSAFLGTMLGYACHLEKNDHDALLCYEFVLKYDPDDKIALYQKALSLNSLSCYEEAAPILQGLIMKCPDDPIYIAEMGNCLFGQGYPEEAIRYYTQVMNMGYHRPDLYTQLYIAYQSIGLKNDALYIAEDGLQEFPDSCPEIYMSVGDAYYEMGWLEEARSVLTESLRKFPGDELIEIMLKKIQGEIDGPDKGKKPPIIRLILFPCLLS